MLHCSGSNILLGTGHGNTRKIIETSCPMLSKTEYQGLSGIHALSGKDYISSIFWKGKKKLWKTLLKYPEYLETFANLRTNEMLQEDTLTKLQSFLCEIYGYKDLSSVNVVRKCTFTSKYEKGKKSLDLCILPRCQENVKFI